MDFKHEITEYELSDFDNIYISKIGALPVILTAVHTMQQVKENGIKKSETYTKSITEYVANKTDCSYYIKLKDNGIESNSLVLDEFKTNLLSYIKDNNIKLLIDIHGATSDHEFDVEVGTLNNLSADFSTLKELIESFNNNDIKDVSINDPFIGGGITKYIYANTDIDIIQIEVSKKYRDCDNFDNMKKLCDSLIKFINQYCSK